MIKTPMVLLGKIDVLQKDSEKLSLINHQSKAVWMSEGFWALYFSEEKLIFYSQMTEKAKYQAQGLILKVIYS